jgi:hypothetical protein
MFKNIWDTLMKICDMWNKVIYFPWNVVRKLWHWVYDEA